jgi:hypothetical protein
MIKANPRITMASRALIHRGDSTHHQDQLMYPVSLRPINNTVSKPGNPMPPEEVEVLLDIIRNQ